MRRPYDSLRWEELIELVCAGDEEALVILIIRCGCPEDILSDVYLSLRGASIWQTGCSNQNYLLYIKYIKKTIKNCRNASKRYWKKGEEKREDYETIIDTDISGGDVTFNTVERSHFRERLLNALDQLEEQGHPLSKMILLLLILGDTIEEMLPELRKDKPHLTRDNAYQIKSRNIKKLRQIDPELANYNFDSSS